MSILKTFHAVMPLFFIFAVAVGAQPFSSSFASELLTEVNDAPLIRPNGFVQGRLDGKVSLEESKLHVRLETSSFSGDASHFQDPSAEVYLRLYWTPIPFGWDTGRSENYFLNTRQIVWHQMTLGDETDGELEFTLDTQLPMDELKYYAANGSLYMLVQFEKTVIGAGGVKGKDALAFKVKIQEYSDN